MSWRLVNLVTPVPVARVILGSVLVMAIGCNSPNAPLRVGTTGDYAPFSFWDDASRTFTGIDVDLATRIGGDLTREVVFVRTTWSTLSDDFRAGRFDLAASGIAIRDDRKAIAAFSTPYYRGGKQAVVRCADQAKFTSMATLDAPTVRALTNIGGTNERFATDSFKRAPITRVESNVGILQRIAAGKADVMFTDSIEAEYHTARDPRLCIGLGGARYAEFNIAVMLRPELKSPVDETLSALTRTGELAALFDRWLKPAGAR